MTDFAWVPARFECSIKAVLKMLETGTRADVAAITKIVQQLGKQDAFEVASYPDRFTIIRKKFGSAISVDFSIEQTAIVAAHGDESQAPIVKGVPTLNEEGRCVLIVDEKEWELWQFRRAALDNLFFRNL